MQTRLRKYYELMEKRPKLFRFSDLIMIETDIDVILEYEKTTGREIGVVYQSPYSTLVVDLIRREDGGYYTYERMLPTVESGAVVVLTKCQGKFVLLKQFRHSLRDFQYACPRGFGELGIPAEENAKKELEEELGAKMIKQVRLGSVIADSGMNGNPVDVFLCEVDGVVEKCGYEGIKSVIMLDEAELEQWIREEKITDGFTLAAYGLYKVRA